MTVKESVTGSCLCGEVQFRLEGKLRAVIYCHCHQCRKAHGHFAAYTRVNEAQLHLHQSNGLRWFISSDIAHRGFCNTCGASLFWQRQGSGTISISAGALDVPTGLAESRHIYTEDAGDYYQITPGLPIFQQSD